MKTLKTLPGQRLCLGHRGENLALNVIFNIAPWVEIYGFGTAHLLHQRNGDEEPYPVATVQDGTEVSWPVSDADTALEGYGKYELRYYVGEALVKSSVGETYTRNALQYGTEPPEAIQGWLDHVAEKENELIEAVADAKDFSEKASGAADNALAQANAAGESARNAALATKNAMDFAGNADMSAKDAAAQAGAAAKSAAVAEKAAEEAKKAVEDFGGIKTVNGQGPDENGNVEVDAGGVKTVNGVEPDAAGNVQIEAGGTGVDVTAQPGQMIRVKEVDEVGKPTAWEPVPWGWVEKSGMVEIFPETTLTSYSGNPRTFDTPWGITPGKNYIVIFNGAEYRCEAFAYKIPNTAFTITVLGDSSDDLDVPATGEPFGITEMDAETATAIGTPGYLVTVRQHVSTETHDFTISVYEASETIHKLPGKFLPDGVPYVEDGGLVEILPETAFTFAEDGDMAGDPSGVTVLNQPVIGGAYTVNWNGALYKCVGQPFAMDGVVFGVTIGNLVYMNGADTGEPFVLGFIDPSFVAVLGAPFTAAALDGSTEAVVSVVGKGKTFHKIDPRCLPEGIPYAGKSFLLEETDAVEDTDPKYGKAWVINKAPMLAAGKTYTVVYNGVPYDCVCFPGEDIVGIEGAFVMGNHAAIGGTDTGEPFAMMVAPAQKTICMDLSGAASVRIGIQGWENVLNVYVDFSDDDNGTADKNSEEIWQAVSAGKTVHLYLYGMICSFICYVPGQGAAFAIPTFSFTSGKIDSIEGVDGVIVTPDGSVFG